MATKFQVKYGQYDNTTGVALSVATPGLVVFSGKTKEIYLDGKTFSPSQIGYEELLEKVEVILGLYDGMKAPVADQASITTDSENGTSNLLIANIGQGQDTVVDGETYNDGKIYTTDNFAVKIAGVYRDSENRNYLATEDTVKTAVENLRAELLGTLDPEELNKTLDTIKEIQDSLLYGTFTITRTDNESGTSEEIPTSRVELVEDTVIGETTYPAGTVIYTDGTQPLENATVYATETTEGGETVITYNNTDEYTYSDLLSEQNLVEIEENPDKDFVTVTKGGDSLISSYKIGVGYGTFKTGHGNVMDETSQAYVDGIATVEDVQKYIEERLTWMSYETDSEDIVNNPQTGINTTEEGGTFDVPNDAQLNNPLVIAGNN